MFAGPIAQKEVNTMTSLQVQLWAIERLIPYARNARTHSDQQVAQIAASIAEFGFNNPVLTDPEGGIIAGHGRVLAARLLGHTEVPVIVLEHLNKNQKQAFMLADNQLALKASWDEAMLRLELEALTQSGFDVQITGFCQEELEQLLADLNRQVPAADPDEAPALDEEAVTEPGDLWVLGNHRLLCGDGTKHGDLERVLTGATSDMIFTDLPYNANYTGKTAHRLTIVNDNLGDQFVEFLDAACQAMLAVSRGAIYICMSSRELHNLHEAFLKAGGHWSTHLIWAKHTFTLGRSDYQRQYEPLLYGWKEGSPHHWCGDRDQGDVWFIDKPHRNDLHPTMKPVELVERAITNSSRKGDVVLDPFAGAGSTVLAAERTRRRACVIEIDPKYADVIVRRWQSYSGKQAQLEVGGQSFEQVAEQRRDNGIEERAA
jgi:DNA modification methylase